MSQPFEFISIEAFCRLIGGDKPISRATFYRGVQAGRYPSPVRVSSNSVRIRSDQADAAKLRLAEVADSK